MRFLILLSVFAVSAGAAPLHFTSGETRTRLVELFTSEGCSSCPLAEQWLGQLTAAPGLWRDFVPVAFHVIYWDRLGWKDHFASREYTERQYAYAQRWGSTNVYTPGFVLDGEEWRGALNLPPAPSRQKAGVLTVTYTEDGECRVRFTHPEGAAEPTEVHVALLGNGITSRVAAGENRGRTLQHDFVALTLKSVRLSDGAATVIIPKKSDDAAITRHALAVWITAAGRSTPLQATGGWLD